ncbi:MAG: hypothetical protein ACLFPF_09595 [Halanaerobiales bacterium]
MNRKNIILIAGVLVIIIGIYLSLALQPTLENDRMVDTDSANNNTGQDAGQDNIDQGNAVPENQFRDAEFVFYNSDGSISWHLNSGVINNYSGRDILELSGVEINARTSDIDNGENSNIDEIVSGEMLYQLSADNSFYNIDSGKIEIRGPINIQKDQIKITTGKLDWQDGSNELTATGGIRIEAVTFTVTGSELTADLAINNIKINGSEEEQAFLSWEKGSDSN